MKDEIRVREDTRVPGILITVIIATRNRAGSLRVALDHLLTPPNVNASDWEVLVVDNGSSDETEEVCGEYRRRFPRHFRSMVEARAGKSHALNSAIQAASGSLLAFADDDVTCAPDFLQQIRNFFSRCDADAVQGRILLDCEEGWPPWLDARSAVMVGLRDCGDAVSELTGTLFGGNMVVKSGIFGKVGGFIPYLGPRDSSGWGEDTELSLRIRRAGLRQMYAPGIVVRHRLPRRKLTRSFLRRRFFQEGRTNAFRSPLPVSLPRFALYVMKECLTRETRATRHRLRNRPASALWEECEACLQAGFFCQHVRFWMDKPHASQRDLLTRDRLPSSKRG
jgi:glycosyltransferase involved in cell wall biosynthesis